MHVAQERTLKDGRCIINVGATPDGTVVVIESDPSGVVARLERFSSAMSAVHVAEHEGEVLGFVAVHLVPRFEHDDRFARVVALVVEAGVRERGIGHLLLGEAERIARDAGAAFIEITAGHHRPEARRLYEAVGYDGSVAAYLRKRL